MGCARSSQVNIKTRPSRISKADELVIQPSTFVISNKQKFQEVYQMGKLMGSGSSGEIRRCFHRQHCIERAVKIFRRSDSQNRKIIKETEFLRQLDHPNIVRVFECFEDEKYYYVIMELCEGGELFEELIKRQCFSEKSSALIVKQLLSAVAYLHSRNIIHRDLKPENILLEDSSLSIKLTDFGTAVSIERNQKIQGLHGTAYYVAPEVLLGVYSKKCDLWSIGVILYILLSGVPPFDGRTEQEIMDKVKVGKFSFDGDEWEHVSDDAKDLIKSLITDESERLSAMKALSHRWFEAVDSDIDSEKLQGILGNLRGFHNNSKLRDAVSMYIATQCISNDDTKELKDAFVKIDVNGDGRLSREELINQYNTLMGRLEAEAEVDRIMNEVDTDYNGFIDYSEFLKASMNIRKVMSVENLRIAFDLFDKDNSGSISANELKNVLEGSSDASKKVWNDIIREVDKNGDGEIDLHEFEDIILRNIALD